MMWRDMGSLVSLLAVLGMVVISLPSAATTEASSVADTCVCIHCSAEVAIGIADVLCDCCSSCLLLDSGFRPMRTSTVISN